MMNLNQRACGVLLHLTSLPGPHGIGDFGPAAYHFVDWLADCGQRVWQWLPTTPVGPGDWKPTPTGKIILDFLNGKMPGYVDTGLNFVGVEDCAAGHLLVAEKGEIGQRYLLGGENLTLKQLLDTLEKLTGLPAPKRQFSHRLALFAAYADTAVSRLLWREPNIPIEGVKIAQHKMFVDCSRAPRELGFAAGPVISALDRAVRWYEANGYLKKNRVKMMRQAQAA